MNRRIIRLTVVGAVVIGAGIAFGLAIRPQPLIVQGEVEATRVDLAPKVSGRVKTLRVDVGDRVKAGDVIIDLESPQLEASLAVAEAALAVASADRDRVYATRQEVIDAQKASLGKAEADVVLAQKVYDRQRGLNSSGFATQQKLDEATNSLEAARKARQAAHDNLTLAEQGNSDQEKSLADARLKQARANVDQIRTDIAELTIRSPVNGQVTTRTAELGELFNPGQILISIVDVGDAWFTFNLREDLLAGLKIGDRFEVRVPALGGRQLPVGVTVINARGDYANWRATKATGDFDLRTFEVRARPVEGVEGLRPGMSGIVAWNAAAAGGR